MTSLSERPMKELEMLVERGLGMELDARKFALKELRALIALGSRWSVRFVITGCANFSSEDLKGLGGYDNRVLLRD